MRIAPRLIAISDASTRGAAATFRMAEAVCDAPAESCMVLLRDYALPLRERLRLAEALKRITSDNRQFMSIAQRLDLCRLVGADAIHLPQHAVSVEQIRQHTQGLCVSAGWHKGETFVSAPDLVLVSPVAKARKGRASLGSAGLAEVLQASWARRSHSYALGGVDEHNASQWLACGVRGLAAIGACYEAPEALWRSIRKSSMPPG